MALALRVKKAAAKLLCSPTVGRAIALLFRDRIWSRGCVIDTRHPFVTPAIKASLLWGLYESTEVRFVRRYLRSDLDVVELGSSIGVIASQIASRLDRSRLLVCVEANPWLLDQIRVNVDRNAPGARVAIVHGALDYSCDERPWVEIALGERNIDSRVRRPEPGESFAKAPTLTLGRILADQGIREYALVCDIEGAEAGIVERDAAALELCRQLIIELHQTTREGRLVTPDAMRTAFEVDHGFRLRDRHGAVFVFEKPSSRTSHCQHSP